MLRRFPILNELPIAAIQSQGNAKMAVQVRIAFFLLSSLAHRVDYQSGVAHEMIKRNQILIQGQTEKRKDLLARLRKCHLAGGIAEPTLLTTFKVVAHDQGKISEAELYEQISTFV